MIPSTSTQRDLFASPPGASITSTADAWCSKCHAKLDPECVQYWTMVAGPFCSLRCADGTRVATSLQREAVQFPRCDECPRPGHFHGKACWVFEESAQEEPAG